MSIIGAIRKLLTPSSAGQIVAASHGADPTSVSRRKFFSFFGTGVVMLAAPELLPSTIRFGVTSGNLMTSGLRAEFAAEYAKAYAVMAERQLLYMLMNPAPELLPNVPCAPDGQALFSTMLFKVDWKENAELKRLAGW